MKKLILTTIALLLVFAVVPAMAGDKSGNSMEPAAFQALSNLSVSGQVALNAMTDKELAAVEGQRRISINSARIRQTNVQIGSFCVLCAGSQNQANIAVVHQSN